MQTPWDTNYADPDNARDVIASQIPDCLEIQRSGFSGSSPPSSPAPVAGQTWFDTTNLREWKYNGSIWVLPSTPGLARGVRPTMNSGDANNDTDFAAGFMNADDDSTMIICPAYTKRLDAVYSAGNNGGLLDTGSKANSTFYGVRAIYNPTTRAADYLATAIGSSPTMPSGFTIKSPILHALLTNGSGNIVPYDAYELPGGGVEIIYDDRISNANDLSMTGSAQLVAMSVPAVAGIEVLFQSSAYHATLGCQVHVMNAGQTDKTFSRATGEEDIRTAGGNVVDVKNFVRRCDSSGRVPFRGTSGGLLVAATQGFRLPRR